MVIEIFKSKEKVTRDIDKIPLKHRHEYQELIRILSKQNLGLTAIKNDMPEGSQYGLRLNGEGHHRFDRIIRYIKRHFGTEVFIIHNALPGNVIGSSSPEHNIILLAPDIMKKDLDHAFLTLMHEARHAGMNHQYQSNPLKVYQGSLQGQSIPIIGYENFLDTQEAYNWKKDGQKILSLLLKRSLTLDQENELIERGRFKVPKAVKIISYLKKVVEGILEEWNYFPSMAPPQNFKDSFLNRYAHIDFFKKGNIPYYNFDIILNDDHYFSVLLPPLDSTEKVIEELSDEELWTYFIMARNHLGFLKRRLTQDLKQVKLNRLIFTTIQGMDEKERRLFLDLLKQLGPNSLNIEEKFIFQLIDAFTKKNLYQEWRAGKKEFIEIGNRFLSLPLRKDQKLH